MVRIGLLAMLAACWHGSPSAASRGVLLRRHTVAGTDLIGCAFGAGTVTTGAQAVPTTVRHRWTEHTREVRSDAIAISLRHVTISSTMAPPHGEPLVSRAALDEGKPFDIDERNRTADAPAAAMPGDPPTRYVFNPLPEVEDLLDVPYPEARLVVGDSFELHRHKIRQTSDVAPVERQLDVRFTVASIVPNVSMHLTCTGSERQTFAFPLARGDSHATVTCSVDLDLRDGRSARWRIDSTVAGRIEPTDERAIALSSTMHHDITLASAGREDAAVCARATEP